MASIMYFCWTPWRSGFRLCSLKERLWSKVIFRVDKLDCGFQFVCSSSHPCSEGISILMNKNSGKVGKRQRGNTFYASICHSPNTLSQFPFLFHSQTFESTCVSPRLVACSVKRLLGCFSRPGRGGLGTIRGWNGSPQNNVEVPSPSLLVCGRPHTTFGKEEGGPLLIYH